MNKSNAVRLLIHFIALHTSFVIKPNVRGHDGDIITVISGKSCNRVPQKLLFIQNTSLDVDDFVRNLFGWSMERECVVPFWVQNNGNDNVCVIMSIQTPNQCVLLFDLKPLTHIFFGTKHEKICKWNQSKLQKLWEHERSTYFYNLCGE